MPVSKINVYLDSFTEVPYEDPLVKIILYIVQLCENSNFG